MLPVCNVHYFHGYCIVVVQEKFYFRESVVGWGKWSNFVKEKGRKGGRKETAVEA